MPCALSDWSVSFLQTAGQRWPSVPRRMDLLSSVILASSTYGSEKAIVPARQKSWISWNLITEVTSHHLMMFAPFCSWEVVTGSRPHSSHHNVNTRRTDLREPRQRLLTTQSLFYVIPRFRFLGKNKIRGAQVSCLPLDQGGKEGWDQIENNTASQSQNLCIGAYVWKRRNQQSQAGDEPTTSV